MRTAPDAIFKPLADPTRRAMFEGPSRDGEQTVRVLTDNSGVSQPPRVRNWLVCEYAA